MCFNSGDFNNFDVGIKFVIAFAVIGGVATVFGAIFLIAWVIEHVSIVIT